MISLVAHRDEGKTNTISVEKEQAQYWHRPSAEADLNMASYGEYQARC